MNKLIKALEVTLLAFIVVVYIGLAAIAAKYGAASLILILPVFCVVSIVPLEINQQNKEAANLAAL